MVEREVLITNETGIHARPASLLVREAMKYPCSIKLIKDDTEADMKSIMSLLALGIPEGSRIIIRAEGERENEALLSLIEIINREVQGQ